MQKNDYEIREVIKEYSMFVPELGYTVKAKIFERVSDDDIHGKFTCSFSHYCKQFEDAFDVYIPSSVRNDLNGITHIVMQYLQNFTAEWAVEANKSY